MTAQHTPGPWEFNDPAKFTQGHGKFSETAVYAPGNAFPWRMAEVQGPDQATEVANARLIAAAPELLAALRLAEEEIHHPGSAASLGLDVSEIVCAAIVKAVRGS